MATVITAEKGLILTSGLKFCTLRTAKGGTKNAELVRWVYNFLNFKQLQLFSKKKVDKNHEKND